MNDKRPGDSEIERAEAYELSLRRDDEIADASFESEHADTAMVLRMLNTVFADTSFAQPEHLPKKIGRFDILRVLGRGGMGIVYLAVDAELDRHVAVKVARADHILGDQIRSRLQREAKAVAQLDHPGIVTIYEVGRAFGDSLYLVMAYCDGPDLERWMRDQSDPIDPTVAADLVSSVAMAIEHGHAQGVLHRDLKPANILLFPHSGEGNDEALPWIPRVTDFGLSRPVDQQMRETSSSLILGTPLYMSPEQAECRSADIGPETDVFGLGAILYQMLTRRAPYEAPHYAGVLQKMRDSDPLPVSAIRDDVDRDLETICMKCIARYPCDRYQSARDVAEDLQRYRSGEPIRAARSTSLQRLRSWTLKPSRVAEAGVAVIVLCLIRMVFAFVGMAVLLLFDEAKPNASEVVDILRVHLAVTLPNDAWIVFAAWCNLRDRISAMTYWVTSLLIAIPAFVAMGIAADILSAPLWYERAPGARATVFSIIAIMFLTQSIAWYFADRRRSQTHEYGAATRRWKRAILLAPVIGFVALLTWNLATGR